MRGITGGLHATHAKNLSAMSLVHPHIRERQGEKSARGVQRVCRALGEPVAFECRAAQRRFRERQKGLIAALKEREETLTKQCQEQKQLIETLQRENEVLKEVVHGAKAKT